MLSVEILADAVLTCGRTARLVSSQTNFNVDVYSAVTADFLGLSYLLGGMLGRCCSHLWENGAVDFPTDEHRRCIRRLWEELSSLSYSIGGIVGWCCSYL